MNGRVVLVTAVGGASGSKAAAAALACAGSEPDRPGLLIDVGGRSPRPTLISSAGARELEERLAVHLPQLSAASRGQTCHLAIDDDSRVFESIRAVLPLARESVVVAHLPPVRLQGALGESAIGASGVLLRADLGTDRALTALAVRNLLDRDLCVAVLKRPLAWVPARRALFGAMPPAAPGGLPNFLRRSLLEGEISTTHAHCSELDDEEVNRPIWTIA
jgi:hypothetical protein